MPEKIVPPAAIETKEARDVRLRWWREARFGMFIHYGIYSNLEGVYYGEQLAHEGAEWYQHNAGLSTPVYEELATKDFSVLPNAADEWVKLAKAAGCEYAVLTSKHHDGFCLFASDATNFSTQKLLGRDVVGEFVAACRKYGLRIGLYHSLLDWHHPEYDYTLSELLPFPKGERVRVADTERDHSKYLEYLHHQVDEILNNYGEIDVIWYDFSAVDFDGEEAWKAIGLMDKIREKHPKIIFNNRLYRRAEGGFSGQGMDDFTDQMDPRYGDFVTPEQTIPPNGLGDVDWEACVTLNDNWGWSKLDKNWKSSTEVIQSLCDIVSKGGNYLLNIGPKPDGAIPKECVERFTDIGSWMKANNEAIKATGPSPYKHLFNWGRVSTKSGAWYLMLFDQAAQISLENVPEVKGVIVLGSDKTVGWAYSNGTLTVKPQYYDLQTPVLKVLL